ncbi:unnamed protein product [Schistosoma turkestanicum]|nr:unnamed protein product [Schistosoma turkestanicum]
MELLITFNRIIIAMLTWAFDATTYANDYNICDEKNFCIFNSTEWFEPRNKSGFVLIGTALILALFIILIKALHTASTWNTIIMVLTLIIMVTGVGLLTLCGSWKEQVFAAIVPFVVMILAVILGERMKGSAAKWRKLLFFVCCVLLTLGIACSIICIICKNLGMMIFSFLTEIKWCDRTFIIAFFVLSAICWCEAMFIVIALTTYYLMRNIKKEDYSSIYMTFIFAFEYLILVILSKLHINYFLYCIPEIVLSIWKKL